VRQRGHRQAQLAGQLRQVQALRAAFGDGLRAAFDARQREQLVGQVDDLVGALSGVFQGAAPDRRFGFAQAQLNPRFERRQRRAQLVGGIGDEARLAFELPPQALGESVERRHQRPQLALHADQWQRPQVIRCAFLHRLAELPQRSQCSADRQPHQHQRGNRQQADAPQGVGQQAARHALAGAEGLGHADLGDAVELRFADRLQQADQAHALALELAVVEARQRRVVVGARDVGSGRRQVLVTADQAPLDVQHPVVDAPGAVVGEGVQRHVGHVGAQHAFMGDQAIGDGPGRGEQGAVVGGIGGGAAVPVGAQAAEQQQQCEQDRQPPQQPRAQAAGERFLSHRAPRAGSRGRGR